MSMTKKIKTLTKKDKADVQKIILNSVDEEGDVETNLSKLKTNITEAVQATRKGQAKYEPYIIERIARTELASLRELTKLRRWAEEGYTKVRHSTRVTPQSSPKCIKLNGTIHRIETLLNSDKQRIPIHANCRCTYTLHE